MLLVPNKHIETPNYKLERLRHDDPRLENLQASYTMIEEPDDEVAISRREKAKAKQEPVIKGVLPDQPAPVATPRAPEPAVPPVAKAAAAGRLHAAPVRVAPEPAHSGFKAWLKKLFGAGPEPVAIAPSAATQWSNPRAKSATAASKAATGDAARRGGRGGRGGERDGRGGGATAAAAIVTLAAASARAGAVNATAGSRAANRAVASATAVVSHAATIRGAAAAMDANRDNREGRDARAEQAPNDSTAPAQRGEARDEAAGAQRRGPRPPREARPVPEGAAGTPPPTFVDTIPVDEAVAAAEAGDGERDGRRRRRRRGGRRDDAGSDSVVLPNDGREATPSDGEAASAMSPTTTDAVREAAPREATAARERDRPWREERSAPAAGDSVTLPPSAAPLPAASGAPTAPAAPAPRVVPPVPHFELPTHALEQLADGAGLQWVQSDADKVRTVQQAIAAESTPAHVPRERKPVALADDGPLVLVETRKDLSQLGLPFERQAEARAQPPQ